MRSAVNIEDRSNGIELIFVPLGIGARAVGELFLPGKKDEANRVLRPDPKTLENPRGFENRRNPRPIVIGALRGVPVVKVRGQQYCFARVVSGKIGNDVALRAWFSSKRILYVEANLDLTLGKQSAQKCRIFAGNRQNRQRRARIK